MTRKTLYVDTQVIVEKTKTKKYYSDGHQIQQQHNHQNEHRVNEAH
jgi:hypothetical protein